MGAVQNKEGAKTVSEHRQVDIGQTRFLTDAESSKVRRGGTEIFSVPMFKRLVGWELELQGIGEEEMAVGSVMTSTVYFPNKQDLQIYLGALLGLRQICEMNIFDDIEIKLQKNPLQITTKQTLPDIPRKLDRKDLSGNINKFIDLLIFLSQMLIKTNNLYIQPHDIAEVNGNFYLRGFLHKSYGKKKLILTYIAWLYEEFENFEDGIESENILSAFGELDIYLKEIYYTIKNEKVRDEELVVYLRKVKEKVRYLGGNFDSFHACFKAKRVKYCNPNTKEWILAKKTNEIYFFNIEDEHVCHGRIIRKKKKINIENAHMIFNSEDFEANFMLEGTKNLVRTSEFELEDSFTISDIEIKYKFPFKMRNPMMFLRGRELYLFDQMVFRYVIDENKLYQQSKKINDCLFLVPSIENNYLIIRLSIDIFRHGIRIYIGDRYETLFPSGNPAMAADIEHIKIDIKHVEFCFEVYKGVYLLLASKNLWILDINFMCFFSYASIERVRDYCKGRTSSHDESDFIFEILNQPFSAHWLSHQHGINIAIKQDMLHVIASVMGKLFYLQYRFIFQAGMLRLLKYRPLFHEEKMVKTVRQIANSGCKESYFNVYNQNLQFYKTNTWLYKGPVFLEVKNIRIVTCKAFSQIFVESEETLANLKDLIEENKKKQKRWGKFQTTMLLYRIFMIYDELCRNGIAHKNFNLNNLWISCSREVKLSGWSEPPRNWHISDYKDFLLVCFNIATQSNYEKLTDKIMQKHEAELQQFPFLAEKMQMGLRAKLAQKKGELQKQIVHLKQSLHRQIYKVVQNFKSSSVIFSFEYNTPRFSALQLGEAKIKKMNAVIEGTTNHQEFTFKSSDYYAWDEQQSSLYILTTNYQMFEAKINVSDFKEETIVLEEYEYLPQNIVDCSFIYTVKGLFAFGGIARHSKKKVVFNRSVYHFNRQKLTWVAVAQLDEPRINPQLILSESGSRVFVMAGELGLGSEYLQALQFDITSFKVERIVDLGLKNPLKKLGDRHSMCIYQISQQFHIFLIWSVSSVAYSFKVFSSMICGFQIDLEGKIYLQQNGELPPVSISYLEGSIHFLRPYGKYTKIALNCFESPSLTNKTLYSN